MTGLSIPCPPGSVWYLGPLPLRAYALAILLGIVVAAVIFQRRYERRGGTRDQARDLVLCMVPFRIIGGRI